MRLIQVGSCEQVWSRPRLVFISLMAVLAVLWSIDEGGSQTPPSSTESVSDTTSVASAGQAVSNVEVAVSLSGTLAAGSAKEALIARDDVFADALSSGFLQQVAPLLLVPPDGPVPPKVTDELERLGVRGVTILGGESAVSPAVATQLAGMDLTVVRVAGDNRISTAVAVANRQAPRDRTAILVRAFGDPAAAPSQGFADALAAGAYSARLGYPILLTPGDALAPEVASYLGDAGIEQVLMIGGTAALSAAVESDVNDLGISVRRVAGSDRFETAVEVAKETPPSAQDAAHIILVEGTTDTAWAGGFAAAHVAAVRSGPVVLSATADVPTATADSSPHRAMR